jgi:hypothetical protein
MTGIFLTGINQDRLSEGYRKFQPGAGFLRTPIFLSSGERDTTATPQHHASVKFTLERTGFTRVRLETFPQGHAVKRDHVRTGVALVPRSVISRPLLAVVSGQLNAVSLPVQHYDRTS